MNPNPMKGNPVVKATHRRVRKEGARALVSPTVATLLLLLLLWVRRPTNDRVRCGRRLRSCQPDIGMGQRFAPTWILSVAVDDLPRLVDPNGFDRVMQRDALDPFSPILISHGV